MRSYSNSFPSAPAPPVFLFFAASAYIIFSWIYLLYIKTLHLALYHFILRIFYIFCIFQYLVLGISTALKQQHQFHQKFQILSF